MSVGITSHVLDIHSGRPAGNVKIELFRIQKSGAALLHSDYTNKDGRLPAPMLSGGDFTTGTYEILFHVGDYFRSQGVELPEPAFLEQVPVRFGIANAATHYHVPLLIAPWGYNTYRGS
ncbi:hydroxyisourate hydrolase [Paenibacillus roseipurpureus]|uniref:5-hydroxyisourate hydrolase n=1 Tax=Paenibacillus roseopurpureus TaxID=2918901 RepID=A0AA96LNK9_9BACL|nr:hydroxyisourate hydrolase [Paenibacillus sp. MBLB1832]WNR45060.1 hydroxyisourate hydrolase [Paenibacillus sp. MBLB1832]